MKQILVLILLAVSALSATADNIVVTAPNSKPVLLTNVTIVDENKSGLTVQDTAGTKTFIPLGNLPKYLADECLHHAHHSMDSIGGL